MRHTLRIALVAVLAATPTALVTSSVEAAPAAKYTSCAALNRVYPNGVGRKGAVDKVSGKAKSNPVRNFKVDTRVYNSLPKTLDRDRDGIACEKHTTGAPKPTPRPAPRVTPPPVKTAGGKIMSSPGGFAFVSPSGNVTCVAGASDVRCDIHNSTFRVPKKPSWCDLDFGYAFGLGRTAAMMCAGDTAAGTASPQQNWFRKTGLKPLNTPFGAQAVLPYGWRLNSTQISCTSATTGVTCTNTTTRHGFTIAKAAYRIF